jgi:hypothetical protein
MLAALSLLAVLFDLPSAALATAAAAGSIPIIIHLLNRRRYRVVTWAAMRFLLAAQRKHRRRLRLEQLVLLALRTLMVLLLVAAMAGVMPWAQRCWGRLFPGAALPTAARSPRTHKILVLDGSLSMALKLGVETCFDRARGLAEQLVQQSSSGDGFSVVLMTAPPRRIVPEPSDDAAKVIAELQALRLPHGNADLGATLQSLEDLLRRSPEKYPEKEVYFFTDLQRSTWTTRQAVDPLAQLQKMQGRARTILVDVGHEGANNLAVTGLTLGGPLATTGTLTPITATVHNYGSEAVKQLRVELRVGRAASGAADPGFGLYLTQHQLVDVAPAQSVTVSFPHKFSTPGTYAVQVAIEPDALELDDVRTATVLVKDTIPVLLVNGKPAVELLDRASEWLKNALNPYEKGQVPRQAAVRPKVIGEPQFADAGLGDLTPYDCVFLCDLARLGGAEIRRLDTHVRSGGGIVFCLGPRVDLEAYNRLLYRNGEGLLPARLVGLQAAPAQRFFSLIGDDDVFKQPPLEVFGPSEDRATLMGARFRQYVRAELPSQGRSRKLLSFMLSPLLSTEASGAEGRPGQSVADLPVGDPALVTGARHRGRVLLLTSTVNMDWTSWPISPSYPAFMQELLQFAVAGRLREQAALVGDVLEAFIPAGGAGLEATVYLPDGEAVSTHTEERDDTALVRWSDTDSSGLYRVRITGHPQEYLFAVNVPTATETQQACESDLARSAETELRSIYQGWDFQLVTDLGSVVHARGPVVSLDEDASGTGIGQAVARYLLLIVLILALIEVVLAWHFGHHSRVEGSTPRARSGRILPFLVGGTGSIALVAIGLVLAHAAWTGDFLGFLPENARRQLESRLGIPAPTPGEGTQWRLEYQPYLWDGSVDPWLAAALILAATGVAVVIYWHEGCATRTASRMFLASLRIGFVLLMTIVILPQLRLLFERLSLPDVAILIDDSRSMSSVDRYQDPRIQQAAERLAALGSLTAPERLQLAQILLTSDKPDWLQALLTQHRVKVHVYHCAARASRLVDITDPADENAQTAAAQAIQGLRPEGDSSQLGAGVQQVLGDFRGSALAAIIMLTDGVTTEGEDLVQAGRQAAKAGVPLFFVGIGDAHEVRDLKLHDLQVEDTVYVHDRIVFEARLTAQGYTDLTVPVTLREKGQQQVLDRQLVRVDPQGKPAKIRLTHRPTQPGERVYVLEVPEQPDEVHPADNNRLERSVLVREMKLSKVLYVEGYARYEYRFLKNLLERESTQDPSNKSIDLKVLLLDADADYAQLDKSALVDFPNQLELNQFDVVIFGDVDPADPRVEKNLVHVVDFVRERGGGFLMIAGERFSPHASAGTPLQAILPIEATTTAPTDRPRQRGFRPELTAAGQFHPIFRFSPDESDNRAIWNRLAELYWWSEGYRAKPGAEVLAIHPDRPAEQRDRQTPVGERHPLILQEYVGAGRSLFYGIDETWRWRFRDDEIRFNQFWVQTVRYLARARLGRVQLRLERQPPYRRGEPIKITVRFPEEAPGPAPEAEVKVLVERRLSHSAAPPELETQTVTLAKVEGSRSTYEAVLTRTPEGDYQFWLAAPTVTGDKPRAECRVLAPPGEMERLQMNQAGMERAAEETHGRFYSLADAGELLGDLPPGTRVTLSTIFPPPQWLLWNHWSIFLLALFLLSSEWFLRKRSQLV